MAVESSYVFSGDEDKESVRRRRRLAEALMAKGMDGSPIASPWQGAARMATGLIGGLMAGSEDKRDREREAAVAAHNAGVLPALLGGGGAPSAGSGEGVPSGQPIKLGGFDPSMGRVFEFEGGLNPRDTNGTPSKFGINAKANPDVNLDTLTREQAAGLYRDRYWNAIGADKMDPRLAHVAFDTAVIAGPGKAQELLKASGGDPEKFLMLRKQFQDSLLARNPEKYGPYAKAWNNRVATLGADIGVRPGGMFAVGSGQPTLQGGDTLQDGQQPVRVADASGRIQQLYAIAANPMTSATNKAIAMNEIKRLQEANDPTKALQRQALELEIQQKRRNLNRPDLSGVEVMRDPDTGDLVRVDKGAGKAEVIQRGSASKPPKVEKIVQPDGSEVLVQWDNEKKSWVPFQAPAEGGTAVRPGKGLTETQSKDANFYNRGSSILDRMDKQDEALTSYVGRYGGQLPVVGNIIKGDAFRQAEQTGRELLAVILRKDTGAAVTKDEVSLYGDMYMPQPGDDPGTIQQKREGRRAAIEGIKLGLPSATILQIQRDKLDALKEKGKQPGQPSQAPAPQKIRRYNPQTGKFEEVTQ